MQSFRGASFPLYKVQLGYNSPSWRSFFDIVLKFTESNPGFATNQSINSSPKVATLRQRGVFTSLPLPPTPSPTILHLFLHHGWPEGYVDPGFLSGTCVTWNRTPFSRFRRDLSLKDTTGRYRSLCLILGTAESSTYTNSLRSDPNVSRFSDILVCVCVCPYHPYPISTKGKWHEDSW